jgi:recombination protein RecA
MASDGKRKAIELAVASLNSRFGKGTVIKLNDKAVIRGRVIPTSVPLYNVALGVGGIPKKRITEVYGPESGGKTTFSLDIVANCQAEGGTAAFVDAEHALDKEYAARLGVNIDDLWLSQPDTAEDCLEVVEAFVKAGTDLVVLDSVAAMVPKAEVEGDMGDSHVGLIARLMSQGLRKIGPEVSKSDSAVIFINQIREKIGVMFGNPETTPGGRALKFWSSVRVEVRSSKLTSGAFANNGSTQKIKIVKNKVAPPFRTAEATLVWGEGYDEYQAIMDAGMIYGAITKSGTWYCFGDQRINRGNWDSVRDVVKPLVLELVQDDLGSVPPVVAGADTEVDESQEEGETFEPEEHIKG